MKTQFAMLTIGTAMCLGLVGCPSPTPIKTDFAQPTTIEGTIVDFVSRPNSPAVVEYREKNGFLASKANASQDGTFSLALPSADIVTSKLEESSLLLLFFQIAGGSGKDCTGELTLNPIVKTYAVFGMGFTQGSFETDRKISSGTIGIVDGKTSIDQNFWIFATNPTQFSGTRTCSDSKIRANLFLKQGWNAANLKLSASNDFGLVIQSVEPAATTWRTNPDFFNPFQ
jgi:hypothetical protein